MSVPAVLIVLQFTIALILIGLGFAAARNPQVPGRVPFLINTVGTVLWSTLYGLLLVLPSEAGTLFAARAQYVGIVLVPMTWFLFAYEYTRQQTAPGWLWAALLIEPVLANIIVWVDPDMLFHTVLDTIQRDGFTLVEVQLGPLFWVHAVYSYVVLLAGTLILLRALIRAQRIYRQQIALLLFASLLPTAANIVTVTVLPGVDLTPVAFGMAAFGMAWSLFRYRLFDIMPVARDRVFASMDDAVFVLDTSDQIVDLNPAAERIFSVNAEDVIGKRMAEAFPGQRGAMLPFLDVQETRAEVRVNEHTFDLQISPLGEKRERGRLIVLRDITDRKKVEAEREALIKELDAYAHTVAHDLKTPLSVIAGYASVIKGNEALPQNLLHAADAVERNSRRLSSIVDDLLLLASVRSEAEIKTGPLDTAAIVTQALERVKTLSTEHGAVVTLPKSWPTALGHPGWVEEIWVNYLSNAIKYGGKPPRIELGAENGADGTVRFWVRDNGKGLTVTEQAKLFREFSRLNEEHGDGHGLGLSIVERIVRRLEGEVGVESEPGKGSRFYFTLPAPPKEKP
ncbi:MAG: histidine kinase N-terminal 7TM domain-containing protein [Anaerolineae bacterium]